MDAEGHGTGQDMMEETEDGRKGEHSDYGRHRSRHRSRWRHHRSSSSSSRSRSSSRRCRQKWAIQKYTIERKEVRKLNAYELIGASIKWALDIEGLTVKDYRSFLEVIGFISFRAMHDHFKDGGSRGI